LVPPQRGFSERTLNRAGAIHDRIDACKHRNEIGRHSPREIQSHVPHATKTGNRRVPTRFHDLVSLCPEAGTNGGAD
jgi:hypothetical protein